MVMVVCTHMMWRVQRVVGHRLVDREAEQEVVEEERTCELSLNYIIVIYQNEKLRDCSEFLVRGGTFREKCP